jgi:hypothetical protein
MNAYQDATYSGVMGPAAVAELDEIKADRDRYRKALRTILAEEPDGERARQIAVAALAAANGAKTA